MKTLIVEDDFTCRVLLQELLREFGASHVAVNGKEAVAAVGAALRDHAPYDLVCLDIAMPEMDGHQALKEIRALEAEHGRDVGRGAKILMTPVRQDADNVMRAFTEQCDAYVAKPIDRSKLESSLRKLGLIGT